MQKQKIWLVRDSNFTSGDKYRIAVGVKPERGFWMGNDQITWLSKNKKGEDVALVIGKEKFEKVAPENCQLIPGGGPVLITIKIRRKSLFVQWLKSLLKGIIG